LVLYDHAEERAWRHLDRCQFKTSLHARPPRVKCPKILGATRILGITWDEAWHIQERAVARGQRAKPAGAPARLGIDEKAAAKGHRYLTVVSNLDQGTVEYVGDGVLPARVACPEKGGATHEVKALTCAFRSIVNT
jgi:transposase